MPASLSFAFVDAKIWLVEATGLSRDALHIYVALSLYVMTRLVWRGRFGAAAGLCVALLAAFTGEWLDHQVEMVSKLACDRQEHWHDIWNTMLWPAVLTLAIPLIRTRAAQPEAMPAPSDEDAERSLEQP